MSETILPELKSVADAFNTVMDKAQVESNTNKHTYSIAELWEKKDEVLDFLIPDLLPKGVLCMFVGEDGIGKTQLMVQLLMHITLGYKTFLTLPLNAATKKAMLVSTEEGKERFIKGLSKQAFALKPDFKPTDVQLDFVEGADFDTMDDLMDEMELQQDAENPYALIVVDAMSDLFNLIDGNINDNTDARRIMNRIQIFCAKHQTTIIIIHHAAKGKLVKKQTENKIFIEKNDTLGAGAITSKARTVLALTNDPKTLVDNGTEYKNFLHVLKANLMAKTYMKRAIALNFSSETLLHTYSDLIDMAMYEGGDAMNGPQDHSNASVVPQETVISYDEHVRKLLSCFKADEAYLRKDLVVKLRGAYGVGETVVNKKDGLWNELIRLNMIFKCDGGFALSASVSAQREMMKTALPIDNKPFNLF